jgi:hypothetical protein
MMRIVGERSSAGADDHHHDHDRGHQQARAVEQRLQQADQLAGDVGDGDEPGADGGSGDQQHHQRGGARSGDEDAVELREAQLAVDDRRHEERVDGGDDAGLGGREDAELEADDDDDRQHERPGPRRGRRRRARAAAGAAATRASRAGPSTTT